MFSMLPWQWAVVGAVALVCVGYMTYTIASMFSRRSSVKGMARQGTALESGLLGVEPGPGVAAFDAWSYRVPARFAGRVRVVVDGDRVSVAGPRAPQGAYRLWVWLQGLTLALVPVALIAALVTLDWRWLLAGLGVLVVSTVVMAVGAGVWPGMGETEIVANDGIAPAVEFPLSSVSDVAVGAGWARGGIGLVVWPYVKPIDKLAEGRAVSFFAPDGSGHEVRYALHCYSDEDARSLARLLKA